MKLGSIAWLLGAALSLGPCEAGPGTDAPAPASKDASKAASTTGAGHVSEADHPGSSACTMAGSPCASDHLPRVSTELGVDGWRRLRAQAEAGMVALALSDRGVELVEGCMLPGRYHEAVAAPDSPGRAWAADRLSFLHDELRGCERATHVVAAFALRNDAPDDGEAIVLPLPCPPLGAAKPPVGCIGAGLDDAARTSAARERWQLGHAATRDMNHKDLAATLPGMLELAALLPEPASYAAVARHLSFLASERYGGCLWYADAVYSAHSLDPEFAASDDAARRRPELTHDIEECDARPSLLTCFPDRFAPGYGGNCW